MTKTQHKLLIIKEVVQTLVDKEVISEKVAEALLIPRHWTTETPLVEDAPTMLFKDLVEIARHGLHYQENLKTYENEYWLTELEN